MALNKIDSPPLPERKVQNRLGSASPGLWLWLACLGLTLAWDTSGADIRVMAWLGDAQGFALRDHWWLSSLGHDGAKRLAVVIYLGLVWMAFRPMGFWRQMPRLQRIEIVVGITLSLMVVTAVKRVSLTSCPWELQAFGGIATYVSHWAWGVSDGGSGHCFPGGHASSAFAFLALSLPWLASTQPHERRTGQKLLATILLMGLVLGAIQTLRGAHFPSHTAWTALICAATTWANHVFWTWWDMRRQRPSKC
ncbi:MAG: phosphatase PAP2 family protein [Limnohabitans sp.]|jgi:membrane-associated PAP2 superfamily phosphatase|nr:phosphatase PAP2 family protein [Limnohabitans sp.]MDP4733257.1 phosphatase PAP2 family protein [Limnohabitans sp.]